MIIHCMIKRTIRPSWRVLIDLDVSANSSLEIFWQRQEIDPAPGTLFRFKMVTYSAFGEEDRMNGFMVKSLIRFLGYSLIGKN